MADHDIETVEVKHADGFVYTINKHDLTADHELHTDAPKQGEPEQPVKRAYSRKAKD